MTLGRRERGEKKVRGGAHVHSHLHGREEGEGAGIVKLDFFD